MLLAPIFLFLVGFLIGLVLGSGMHGPGRVTGVVLLWLPIVALLLIPDARDIALFFLPRAATYPLLGMLVGFSLRALLAGPRR